MPDREPPSPDDLSHLRGDVRQASRPTLERVCASCGDETTHDLFEQHPAVLTTGAYGKYLNPVYRCRNCDEAHTLLVYETGKDADQPRWGAYPEDDDDN